MKSKRIISFILAAVKSITAFGVLAYAAPGGEETWPGNKGYAPAMSFSPSDGYVSQQNAPDFIWPYVDGAKKYDLIVCSDPELTDIKYSVYDLERNFYTFPITFETGVHYYWAVRYFDGKEYSEWSNARRFRISPDAYEFVYPGAEALMARIPGSHPRIYATSDTLETFRGWKDKNESAKKAYDTIIGTAKSYLTKKEIPDSNPKLETDPNDAAKNGTLLQSFRSSVAKEYNKGYYSALGYLLTGDEEMGRYAIDVWMAISKWDINGDTSYKSQDQVHREIALYGAMSYDWLYDLMNDSERKQLRDMVVARTEVMEYLLDSLAKSCYDSHGWTAYGFIGIISLALYGDTPKASDWIERVFNGYVPFLPPWSYQDGGWSQGTDYWQYSTNSNKDFIEVLALAGIFDLSKKAWSQNEYLWMLYAYPPNSYGSFGDQSDRNKSVSYYSGKSASRQLAFDRENGVLKWLFNQWGGTEAQTGAGIVGYYTSALIDDIKEEAPITYPLAHEFNDIGWTVMSNDLIAPNRIQCTFKSSPYGSFNHSHADQNSFIIQAYGENLAIKSGYYDSYHTPHDSGFTRKTGAHNSVTIANSIGQNDDDFNAKGKLAGFLNQIDFDMSAGDATQAYKGALDKYERCMIYIRPDVFVVIDELDAKDNSKEKFEWWLNAEHDIKTYEDGTGARLQEGAAVLDARVQYPQNVKTFYNNTFALSDMTVYPASGNYKDANVHRRVWFQTPKVDRTKMVVTMDVHQDSKEARYVDTQYYDDYIKMTFEDGTVMLVNLREPGTSITTKEGITFDGAAVTYNDDSVMLSLGTVLKWGDTELIRCEERASVVMGKDELGISSYTDQRISINTNNDYVKGITKITDYNGSEISAAYGITTESGMLEQTGEEKQEQETKTEIKTEEKKTRSRWEIGIPVAMPKPSEEPAAEEAPAEEAEAKAVFEVNPNAEGITFSLDRDNYTLMLNGKLIKSSTLSGNVKVNIDGEEGQNFTLSGYMRRDGSSNYNGKVNLDGQKYVLRSISPGLDFGGMKVGDVKGITELNISASNQENEVTLEHVPVKELSVDKIDDCDSVKNNATVFIEAENASLIESGNKYDTRKFMSGGAGVTKHDTPGTNLVYNVEIPEDGDYTLSLDYVAWLDGGAVRGISIDGKAYQITLPQTNSWGAEPSDWRVASTRDTIHLAKGTYTMYIEAISNMWNLDWIAFTKK